MRRRHGPRRQHPNTGDLERGNVFLVPLDDHRCWYRYHQLFADVLRARLLAEQPDLVPGVHRRASDWYATHDLAADAVRHAIAAGDFDRAAYLVEEALPDLRRARQDSLLLAWTRSLPEPVLRRSPVLSILSAWSRMMSGDLDAAEGRLDDAEHALAAGAQDKEVAARWADTEDLRTAPATICVYRASLAQARGDVAGTVRHARHALALTRPEDHFVRGAAGGFLRQSRAPNRNSRRSARRLSRSFTCCGCSTANSPARRSPASYMSHSTPWRTHTKRIFTKLDVMTRAAAVRRAHERGLL